MIQLMTHPLEGQLQLLAISVVVVCFVAHFILQKNNEDKE